MTSHRIGVNLRVSGNCDQGARKYMEDNHVIKFLKKDTDDYEFAYFGIFDGHGGPEASAFCKDNLLNEITKYDGFWTDDDDQVLAAIRKGFLDTHNAMWNVLDSWPKTVTGLPSTAGSTATIAVIKQGKLYTGHVGDSALVLGENSTYSGDEFPFQAVCITKEHKPDDPGERLRIQDAGGEVINKSGVPRVVWSRPKTNHKGPVRRSTQIDQIPFLAVARSLGDLWSYDYYTETYVVSPDPDVTVMKLDAVKHRCLVLASDGLWNMLTPEESVNVVMDLETQFEQKIISDPSVSVSFWSNPAERLVSRALNKWRSKSLKADNTSCVVVLIDPLGPSKLTLLRQKRQALLSGGEITQQFDKVPKLPTEIDHRNKSRNKNTNCNLSDSHIRATDDSVLQVIADREHSAVPMRRHQSFTTTSKMDQTSYDEECYRQCLNECAQPILKPPIKWHLRPSMGDRMSNSIKSSSCHSKKMSLPAKFSEYVSPSESFHRKSDVVFTKLVKGTTVTAVTENKCRMEVTDHIQQLNNHQFLDSIHEDFVKCMEEKIEVEEGVGEEDSDFERLLSKPLPCAPCSDANGSDGENSLQSSADVTDTAFSLASDESLDSPECSFSGDSHPPAPRSAPAKLSSSRARRSSMAKGKLARKGLKLQNPPLDINKGPALFNLPTSAVTSSNTKYKVANSCSKTSTATISAQDNNTRNEITKYFNTVATPALVKDFHTKPKTDLIHMSSSKHSFLSRQVLNISKSVNHGSTPKNQREKLRSLSCTGLTPDMSLLMSKVPRSSFSSTCTTRSEAATRLLSSIMAARSTNSRNAASSGLCLETSMIVDDRSVLHGSSMLDQTEPLKQLNKTGPVRKIAPKRWSSFFHMSKQGIDQIFHIHSKGTGELARTSSGILGCDRSRIVASKKTLSTSKLNGSILAHHLPDITVSHLADVTVNASSADLTSLSVLSGDNSILKAADLTTIHHSMLQSLPEKTGKQRKGFLQKTRVTLRRASKAAKKAFFPENHRLFHKSAGKKRRSTELFPTPEAKRRKQLDTNRT